jgi:O-methyltransferase domain
MSRLGVTDPAMLYRLRDGVYAPDLLIVAIAELDLFTQLHVRGGIDFESLCEELHLGPALAEALSGVPATRVLDVGGSSGIYACALVDHDPLLRATVLERPPVDRAARALLADRGYWDRIDVDAADMFTDPFPDGYDLHLFSHVLHDWGEERVRRLFVASFAAPPPGGWIVNHDTHINAEKTGPLPVAEYSVLLMHSTPGKCWSVGELGAFLEQSRFTDVACRPTASDRTVVLARRPD